MNREESPDWLWPMAFEKRGEKREEREKREAGNGERENEWRRR